MNIIEVLNKSLFFLGAGASWDAKCKLSSGMLSDLKKRIVSKDDDTFNRPEKEALKFLLSCLEYHSEWRTLETSENFKFIPNIEELALLIRRIKNRESFLPYPITGNWADKLILLESEFKSMENSKNGFSLFSSLDHKIKCELLPEWLTPSDYTFLDPLRIFLEYCSKNFPDNHFRIDMFSLNNDLVIENYFTENKSKPWRGFSNGKWVGFEEEDIPNDFGRINLYKLHGSLDWVRLDTGDFKEEYCLSEQEESHIEEEHSPYVIFGQGTKTFSIEPFFTLINHFRKKLREKDYFFVIGYSFFDPYINNLLIEAVKGTSKKIIIVNPFFGPEKLINEELKKIEYEENFLKILYPKGASNKDIAYYIEDIQKNSFYSELPEFNIKQINAESIEFLPVETKMFLEKYFNNNGETFLKLVLDFEEKRVGELPF